LIIGIDTVTAVRIISVYTTFNPTIAQLTINNHLSLYNMPSTCLGLNTVNIGQVCYEGM
jgi:hypothetical protein